MILEIGNRPWLKASKSRADLRDPIRQLSQIFCVADETNHKISRVEAQNLGSFLKASGIENLPGYHRRPAGIFRGAESSW